jgi:hypothetical protein
VWRSRRNQEHVAFLETDFFLPTLPVEAPDASVIIVV